MTIRLRLAMLFAAVFLVAGAGLLALNYVLVRDHLPAQNVSARNAQDVISRAQRLVGAPKLPDDQRQLVEQVATANVAQATALIVDHPNYPPPLAQLLFSDLPNAARADALHQLVVQSIVALAIMLVVSGGLGWFVAGRALRPLHDITDTAQHISATNLHDRIARYGPDDEIKRLADTFDHMLDRLDTAFSSQRLFVANASHELRTPLTIMRTELDVTLRRPDATVEELRQMGTTVRRVLDRCDQLITNLLALAGAEASDVTLTRVDLAVSAGNAVRQRAADIERNGLHAEVELTSAPVTANAALLDRALENLIDNAIVHNHNGGWFRITTSSDQAVSRLEITSTGAHVSTDDAPTVFEPFHRLNGRTRSARGTGIGLSIVRAVALAHNAVATALPNPGGGLIVTITFPRAPRPDNADDA
jgi:signal transduction histidine kinase